MKSKALLLTCLMLAGIVILNGGYAYSQHQGKARMKGVVTDPEGKPVPGVKVKLYSFRSNSGFETQTDAKGEWKALWVRGGKWNIDFEKSGYAPKKISTSLKEDSRLVIIETTLETVKGPAIKKDMVKDFEKGNNLFAKGKFDEALAVFEKIVQEFPDAYAINLNVGNCYFEKEDYEKAIRAYMKVAEKEPKNTDILLSIGNSYSNMKKIPEALEWYKKIQVAKINDPLVLYNIGVFNFNAGKIEDALPFFKRSTEIKNDFQDGWYQLGMCQMSVGKNNEAITAFEAYLKIDGTSAQAAQVKEILNALKQSQ
jgi:tetratricopeptide (TPR) repeat protein